MKRNREQEFEDATKALDILYEYDRAETANGPVGASLMDYPEEPIVLRQPEVTVKRLDGTIKEIRPMNAKEIAYQHEVEGVE